MNARQRATRCQLSMQLQRSAPPFFLKAVHTRFSVRIAQCDTVQIPVLCRIPVPLLGALLRAMAHDSNLTHSERIVQPSVGEQSTRDITREAPMSDELSGSLFRASFCSCTSCSRHRKWDAIACHRTCQQKTYSGFLQMSSRQTFFVRAILKSCTQAPIWPILRGARVSAGRACGTHLRATGLHVMIS